MTLIYKRTGLDEDKYYLNDYLKTRIQSILKGNYPTNNINSYHI